MNDMLQTIAPKSDQLNADDFIGGRTMTITITGAKVNAGEEQPTSLSYEGDNGKPYKPGKSMRRVIVLVWGNDSKNYIGRSMTLYCDPKVKFGGVEVGGIRISHMSHMKSAMTMALTSTRANKKPFTVQPLVINDVPQAVLDAARDNAKLGREKFLAWYNIPETKKYHTALSIHMDDLKKLTEATDGGAK
jgi:hypothetical protein